MVEQRRFERVVVNHEAELSFRAENLVTTEAAYARDLSMGGARVGAQSCFPVESIVKLELRLPSDTVTVLGSVRYAVACKGSHPYDLGIKFIGLDNDEAERIYQAISSANN
ncbi:MAG: PilZ domain-containing protein [Nitrospirota bacterium]|nr:PilZ domain-containing protein [Nitrospirota bacterium]